MFPIIHMGMAVAAGIFKSEAARSPPLSSRIGTIEIMKITISAEINWDRLSVNHCTNTSILPPAD